MVKNFNRMNLKHNIINTNFLNWEPTNLDISAILLDAPCSGTGTFRRNPDIIWHRKKSDIMKLSEIQMKLLEHSFKILKVGGTLVYTVCSIEPEEGINVAKKILNLPNIKLSKITSEEIPKLKESITNEGFVQILPHYWSEFGGLDGFFITRFEKSDFSKQLKKYLIINTMKKNLLIAPSILSSDFSRLGDEISDITNAGADMIHIDVMDGHFVPNLTIGPDIIKSIRNHIDLMFDVHLMIENVDKYIPIYSNAGADIITIHSEVSKNISNSIKLIQNHGKKAGLAFNPSSSIEISMKLLKN